MTESLQNRRAVRVPLVALLALVLHITQVSHAFLKQPPLSSHHRPRRRHEQHAPASASQTSLALFKGVRDIFSRRQKRGENPEIPPDEENMTKYERFRQVIPLPPVGERRRYSLGVGSSRLPSIEDLWAEAWPTIACGDAMERRDALNEGSGPPDAEALVRRFGQESATIQTVFYKDAASWCPYCASVWMMLEEKQLPYTMKRINLLSYGEKPEWLYDVSGTGLMPVLEVGGRILRESVDICKFIDWWRGNDISPAGKNTKSLWPTKGNTLHTEAEALLGLERDLFRDWFIYVFEGPEERGREEFWATLLQVETALAKTSDNPWFLPGTDPSLVDIVFAPKVERMVASCLYWKGMTLRGHAELPALGKWLDALDRRPSYAAIKADFFSLVNGLEPLFGRAYGVETSEVKEIRRKIDGLHYTSWRLPVSAEENIREYLPPDTQPSESYARQRAAVRLILNNKRLPRYMARALGTPGPEHRSPLADPHNAVDEWVLPEVDAAYRYLVLALLRGKEVVAPLVAADKAAADTIYGGPIEEARAARGRIVACLNYLKFRVGVPRDMTLAEARQVRGTLTWLVEALK